MSPKTKHLPVCPDLVKVELVTVAKGETGYWIEFSDEQVELLAQGICSKDVAQYAWEALAWKRDHERKVAREMAS